MKASPITLRNDSMVSTSQCDAATILTSTSDAPSTAAAASPGAEAKAKRKVKGEEDPVDVWMFGIRRADRGRNPYNERVSPAFAPAPEAARCAGGGRSAA